MNISTFYFDTLDSTNTEALKRARQGADEGTCIVARQQTAGRGRYGRVWVSEKDNGLYFSMILRPRLETRFLPLITLMCGVAVHEMLRKYGLEPDIKWVNDILVDERKISGILAETAETERGIAVVVGVGINLRSNSFPPEIAETAVSLEDAGVTVSPHEAAGNLSDSISYFYRILSAPGGSSAILDEWAKRSSYFSGKAVKAAAGDSTVTGVTDGLEDNGALRIKTSDRSVVVIQTGEVERLRAEELK